MNQRIQFLIRLNIILRHLDLLTRNGVHSKYFLNIGRHSNFPTSTPKFKELPRPPCSSSIDEPLDSPNI